MYIPIQRIEETDDAALYAFRVQDETWARFWIDRASGTARLEEAPDVPGIEGCFARAARRVRELGAAGCYPVRTCWAG